MALSLTPVPGHEPEDQVLADINVTPLVDVMLVLLIVFMIAAPMLHQGIDVRLPESRAEALAIDQEDPLVLSVNRDGLVYVRDEPIHPSQLVERLTPILERRSGEMVFVKADRELAYGKVVEVLDLLNEGGIHQVGMVTELPPER